MVVFDESLSLFHLVSPFPGLVRDGLFVWSLVVVWGCLLFVSWYLTSPFYTVSNNDIISTAQ